MLSYMPIASAGTLFSDIEHSWYKDSIVRLANEKIISGYGDGTFWGEKSITRAEILKIILQASGNGLWEVPVERCFPDVSETMWYHGYICRAYALRVTNGFDDGTFRPDATVTTVEALAFWLRAFDIEIPRSWSGESWYEPMRRYADEKKIIPIDSYTRETLMSRGRAAELITRIRTYKQTLTPLDYKSIGCSIWHDLSRENTITIAGKERKYLLTVPRGYLKVHTYPLIIANHGRTNSNEQVKNYMWVDNTTDFIVAYPAWLDVAGGGRSWSEAENLVFFDAMISDIADAYCIDRSRIYAIGHSLGGWFTQKLACLRGDIISGMASVGSAGYSGNCTGPAASLIYQNPDDALSPYSAGVAGRTSREKINLCSTETTPIKIGWLECKKSLNCSTLNPVIWCEWYPALLGDPHSWPTSGAEGILTFLRDLR